MKDIITESRRVDDVIGYSSSIFTEIVVLEYQNVKASSFAVTVTSGIEAT